MSRGDPGLVFHREAMTELKTKTLAEAQKGLCSKPFNKSRAAA